MKMIIVLIGNIGTGKTTYARTNFKYNRQVLIEFDSVFSTNNLTPNFISDYIKEKLDSYDTVIIDGNNVTRSVRQYYADFARKNDCVMIAYNFGMGTQESLEARLKDPRGETQEYWSNIHERNMKLYEQPELNEGFDEIYIVQNGAINSYTSKNSFC